MMDRGASRQRRRLAAASRLARRAAHPFRVPWPVWRVIIRFTLAQMISDRVTMVAAGCAFYATLALFPAISMLLFIYGLAFDPVTVEPQLHLLNALLPGPGVSLIDARIRQLVSHHHGTLTAGLAISAAVTLWSAMTGTKSVLAAVNMAYGETERRGFFRYQLVSLTITVCAVGGAALAIAILVFLPVLFHWLGLPPSAQWLIRMVSVLLLVVCVLVSVSLLFRFGPSRKQARWAWITPGSVVATVLWLAASALFSWYVSAVSSYDALYGPLGAVVAVMMWFYVTTFAVLLGAELNAQLERQTTHGGVAVADHLAEH
jgi:membrane protein